MNKFCKADINILGLKKSLVYDGTFPLKVSEFKSWFLRNHIPQFHNSLLEEFYVLSETNIKHDEDFISEDQTYHFLPRLVGGKGGFGSMLRAIGAQIEKTTNREACRDLSGRRMRDINNEKQLKDWMAKQKDREKERARRREEKAARRRAEPLHKFEDRLYDQQKEKVSQDLDEALQQGLKRAKSSTATSSSISVETTKKRKVEDSLQKQWNLLGVIDDSSSDMSAEDDDDVTGGAQACPGLLQLNTIKSEESTSSSEASSSSTTKNTSKCERQSLKSEEEESSSPSSPKATTTDKNENDNNIWDLPTVLKEANCAEDLECLGLEKLKLALINKGLKCGGTLAERAQRLFAVRGLSPDQIDPSFFVKPTKGKGPKKNK